jgi:hypothetical protein
LFCIEKDDLKAQVAQALGGNPQQKGMAPRDIVLALQGKEIGNANYIVDPTYLSMSVLRLAPRPNGHGEGATDLDRADSKFQRALQRLNLKQDSIVFMTRDDSAIALR